MRDTFQEEATEAGGVEEKKERARDDAKVSGLSDWKEGGAIDRNRDLWGRSWLEKQIEMQPLNYETETQKRGQERKNCKSSVENMKAEG